MVRQDIINKKIDFLFENLSVIHSFFAHNEAWKRLVLESDLLDRNDENFLVKNLKKIELSDQESTFFIRFNYRVGDACDHAHKDISSATDLERYYAFAKAYASIRILFKIY